MNSKFSTVGLVGKANQASSETYMRLREFLTQRGIEVKVAPGRQCDDEQARQEQLIELGQACDLVIVVGGDGNMLGAARAFSKSQTPVIGVNRGNLGFLTDLNPDAFETTLSRVLMGDYRSEKRFLLDVTCKSANGFVSSSAVNEAVLHSGQVAQMIEFEVYINDNFMFSQRADGLIVCTPTGSTAYSLSAGGPILTPDLEVLCLQPMFPHSLSHRPIVVDANSCIRLVISKPQNSMTVTCDGHNAMPLAKGDEIRIKKQEEKLTLLHPKDYSYYNVIRRKLNWGSKLY
ncbi:NAD(+) kinase [Saccharobesus litoralis]|uniref:NAD kinase n=1 Tax=Saccharobesus litoralis TaxID=2172099 RepID=A0A2S0VVH4_9ALTE|nr:NAD(+) kinase [Saccharobesus litoralis]AWB68195.1 NAD(+) kinase [Saccharobesus litoralis]